MWAADQTHRYKLYRCACRHHGCLHFCRAKHPRIESKRIYATSKLRRAFPVEPAYRVYTGGFDWVEQAVPRGSEYAVNVRAMETSGWGGGVPDDCPHSMCPDSCESTHMFVYVWGVCVRAGVCVCWTLCLSVSRRFEHYIRGLAWDKIQRVHAYTYVYL